MHPPDAPLAIVIRSPGANCDREMLRAFELAGARAEAAHVDALIADPARLAAADLIGIPGGFSYGDDIASGRALAVRLRERLYPALREAAGRGVPMIGVCNGFQVLCQAGLLPGPEGTVAGTRGQGLGSGKQRAPWPLVSDPSRVALAENIGARFIDRWLPVSVEPGSVCVWTKDLWPEAGTGDQGSGTGDPAADGSPGAGPLLLPIAHGEGRFVPRDEATLTLLEERSQIALRYLDNANGSTGAVAGVCDATGRIFGLMPHPERFLDWTRHPSWTRLSKSTLETTTPGRRMFMNAVEAAALSGSA